MPRGICWASKPFSHGCPVSETISSFLTTSRSTSSTFGRSGTARMTPTVDATDSTMVTRRSFMTRTPVLRSTLGGPGPPGGWAGGGGGGRGEGASRVVGLPGDGLHQVDVHWPRHERARPAAAVDAWREG